MSYHGFGITMTGSVRTTAPAPVPQAASPFVYAQLAPNLTINPPINIEQDFVTGVHATAPDAGNVQPGAPILLQVGQVTVPTQPSFNISIGPSNTGAAVGAGGDLNIPGGNVPGGGDPAGQCDGGLIPYQGPGGSTYCCPSGYKPNFATMKCDPEAGGGCPAGQQKFTGPSGQPGCCPIGTVANFSTGQCVPGAAGGGSSSMILIGVAALAALFLLKK